MTNVDLTQGLGPVSWFDSEEAVRARLAPVVELHSYAGRNPKTGERIKGPPAGVATSAFLEEGGVHLPGIVRFVEGHVTCLGVGSTSGFWTDALTDFENEDFETPQRAYEALCLRLGLTRSELEEGVTRTLPNGDELRADDVHLEIWRVRS
jgi:hypothetical protein